MTIEITCGGHSLARARAGEAGCRYPTREPCLAGTVRRADPAIDPASVRALWSRIEAYRRRTRCTLAAFGAAAGLSPRALENVRRGVPVRSVTIARVVAVLRRYPAGIPGAATNAHFADHAEGGAAALRLARAASAAPARPCPVAAARAAAEDRRAARVRSGMRA